jgi:hypothetical protein
VFRIIHQSSSTCPSRIQNEIRAIERRFGQTEFSIPVTREGISPHNVGIASAMRAQVVSARSAEQSTFLIPNRVRFARAAASPISYRKLSDGNVTEVVALLWAATELGTQTG